MVNTYTRADFTARPGHLDRICAAPIYPEDFGADPLTVCDRRSTCCGTPSAWRTR
ncbi:hypothetical protein R69746_08253 [Paraburkholderia aspalathi]|nr:hypothetical protein R69746_08253 [Paraburkholderia aspalathi]CAE6871358.1 hypothetical protein R75465_08296 [Paraburkholderia aspalathi]